MVNFLDMHKLRIGKDFAITWPIYSKTGGEKVPYVIDAKNAELKVHSPFGDLVPTEVRFTDNLVKWIFRGRDQKQKGVYNLELVVNDGKDGMVTVDTCKAFALVGHSCEESVDAEGVVLIDAVTLDGGEVNLAPVQLPGESYDDTELREMIAEQDTKLTELSAEVSEVSEAVGKKADEQGYYPNLSVGMADNLLGHAPAVEREIVFDATASKDNDVTEDVARIEAIKGNSLVWNQLLDKGKVWNALEGPSYVYNDVADEYTIASGKYLGRIRIAKNMIVGHKYIISYDIKITTDLSYEGTYYIGYIGVPTQWFKKVDVSNAINKWYAHMEFFSPSASQSNLYLGFYDVLTLDSSDTQVIRHPRLIDLTQMFGSGNEPTTIDEFYSRIPSGVDINAYNEGEVIHNYATGLKSVGFNAWDEEIEMGALFSDGSIDPVNTRITTSFIPVIPNTTYYQFSPNSAYNGRIVVYDENKVAIYADLTNGVPLASKAFTTPSNAKYMRLTFGTAYGTTYNHDICIHLAHTGYRNGEYAPYWEESIGLPNTLVFADGMKSAGSARDEVYYDRYAKKWRVIKRIGEVDLGSLTWSAFTTMNGLSRTQAPLATFIGGSEGAMSGILCSKFVTVKSTASMTGSEALGIFGFTNNRVFVLFKEGDYADAASFKAAVSGVTLYYELAEPIESDLDDYLPATMSAEERAKVHQFIYRVSDFGTEQMLTEEGVKSSALVADIVYGVDAFRTLVNLRKRVAALEK